MRKIITVIMLVIAITLCGACTSPQEFDDLKTQTAALERLVDELQNKQNGNEQNEAIMQEKIKELQKLNDELQNKLSENEQNSTVMNEEIAELKKQNDLYKAQLRNLTGKPIEYDAEKPIYQYYHYIDNDKKIAEFESDLFNTTPFLELLKYNEENRPFGDKKIFVFRPDDYEDEGCGRNVKEHWRCYKIFEHDGAPMLEMIIEDYNDIFGDGSESEKDLEEMNLYNKSSLHMRFFFVPVDAERAKEMSDSSLRLKFGKFEIKYEIGKEDFEKPLYLILKYNFINIFINDICIGTCYYTPYSYISYTGFRDYLYKHLEIL